jgi:hypothetical protein
MATKRDYDRTRTKRANAHLERLTESQGKRTVVDLDRDRVAKLKALKDLGYGTTNAEVVRRALDEAHERITEKR